MQRLFILDASGYLYRSYFAIRNITNSKGESTNALFGFIRSIQKLFKDFSPHNIIAIFDGPRNSSSRKQIYTDYKAHRSETPQDLIYQIDWGLKYCELMGIPYLQVPDVEADDTMGSIALWAAKEGFEVFLCTSDKDLCQMVDGNVKILNTHKENLILGEKEVEESFGVPPKLMVDYLSITGDASDNIPGLSGFGPKTAASLLQQFGSLDALLANPEAVPGKKKQDTIRNDRDKALLSRALVKINTEVAFPKNPAFFHLKTPDFPLLREFYINMNFNSLLKELEQVEQAVKAENEEEAKPIEQEQAVSYSLVEDEASLRSLVHELAKNKEISFTTLASDPHPLRAELIGIGFTVEQGKSWYIPLNGPLKRESVIIELKPLFENPHIGFYSHNAKFDLHILRNQGIRLANICFDTMLASYLLNSHSRKHTLDYLMVEYFGKVRSTTEGLVGKGKNAIPMQSAPLEMAAKYVGEAVDYTYRLHKRLYKELEERKLMALMMDLELPLIKVLAKMERRGIYLDKHYLTYLSTDIGYKIRDLEQDIYFIAQKPFNLNSPKQVGEVLFTDMGIKPPKKTATGHSTDADVLESLKNDYPIAGKLLEYRFLEKLRSTYVDSLPAEILPKTQRIHCTFNQTVAATGRLSCQDPNLQNIPVRVEFGRKVREAFRPEKSGWSYLAADYSQIELRLLAHFSEDPQLLNAFKNNEDVHAITAASIFDVPLELVTKEMRYQAKTVNFGVIYGQQAFGLAKELGIDIKEADRFIKTYFARYPKVKEFIETSKEKARLTGKTLTATGRERAIPEINSKNGQIRALAERLAVNTPLQGTAADIIKMAMLEIDKRLKAKQSLGYMVLQIHDELIFEIPNFEVVLLEQEIREIMEGIFKLKIPLLVDITIGKNWKEC